MQWIIVKGCTYFREQLYVDSPSTAMPFFFLIWFDLLYKVGNLQVESDIQKRIYIFDTGYNFWRTAVVQICSNTHIITHTQYSHLKQKFVPCMIFSFRISCSRFWRSKNSPYWKQRKMLFNDVICSSSLY